MEHAVHCSNHMAPEGRPIGQRPRNVCAMCTACVTLAGLTVWIGFLLGLGVRWGWGAAG